MRSSKCFCTYHRMPRKISWILNKNYDKNGDRSTMNKKIEEMVALGAAYAVNCQPCMEIHKQKAIEVGPFRSKQCKLIRTIRTGKTHARLNA